MKELEKEQLQKDFKRGPVSTELLHPEPQSCGGTEHPEAPCESGAAPRSAQERMSPAGAPLRNGGELRQSYSKSRIQTVFLSCPRSSQSRRVQGKAGALLPSLCPAQLTSTNSANCPVISHCGLWFAPCELCSKPCTVPS